MPAFFLMQQKKLFFVFKTDKKILQIYKNIKQEDAKSFLKTFRVHIKDVGSNVIPMMLFGPAV